MRIAGWAIVAAASLVAGLAYASAITDSLLRDRLLGGWADDGNCAEWALIFRDDGSFALTDVADPASNMAGTFEVKDGKLAGQAGARVMPVLPIVFNEEGWLILGPDMLQRCKGPLPTAPANPARP